MIRRLIVSVLMASVFVVGLGSPADARLCARVYMLDPFSDIWLCIGTS